MNFMLGDSGEGHNPRFDPPLAQKESDEDFETDTDVSDSFDSDFGDEVRPLMLTTMESAHGNFTCG